jgi:hypothetical protein
MSGRTGVSAAYPAQILKLRRTQELGCCAGFGGGLVDEGHRHLLEPGRGQPSLILGLAQGPGDAADGARHFYRD